MLSLRGIYDGKKIVALDEMPKDRRFKVIITLIEEIGEEEDIRKFTAQTSGLDFWNNPREDLYQDFVREK